MPSILDCHKLLVAIDFSPASRAALQQAVWLARQAGGSITLVHVLPNLRQTMHSASIDAKLDLLYGEGSQFQREVLGDAEARLQTMIEEANAKDLVIKHKILIGDPLAEICRLTQLGQYDVVFAGAHAMTVWKELFVGSTAKKLTRTCPAPMWIVRPDHVGKPVSILAATDLSPASRRGIEVAMALAEKAKAQLHLLHVVDSADVPEDIFSKVPEGKSLRHEINEAAQQRFDAFVASLAAPVNIQSHLTWGTPWKEINRYATGLQVDLLVVGSVGRSGLPGLFLGNTAEQLLATCESSVLTVKPDEFACPIPLVESVTFVTDRAAIIG